MLHPVGRLPSRVYWRRRLIVLVVLLGLLAGGGWLTLRLLDEGTAAAPTAAATRSSRAVPTPALEQVVPSLAGVRTPETAPPTPTADPRRTRTPSPAGPTPGSACTDEMIDLSVRAPSQVRAGSKPTLEIVVRNVSAVPCVRRLDKQLQEILLLDTHGKRVWGSNDCFPERGDQRQTLAPGKAVAMPIVWSGLSSKPKCAGQRTAPPPGVYLLRGRLESKTTPDRRIRLVQL